MDYTKPLPEPNGDSRPFWDGCRKHQLRFQKCGNCEYIRWPPSNICPECYSQDAEWITSSGRGKLYTYAVYHQAYDPAFKADLPYVVAVIELEEGQLLISNLVQCTNDVLRCDMPVEVTWDDVTPEFSLPKFRPVQDLAVTQSEP